MKSALRVSVLLCAALVCMIGQPVPPLTAAPSVPIPPIGMCAAPSSSRFIVEASPSAVAYAASGGETQMSCEDGCVADRSACVAATCPTQFFCEPCDQQYQACIAACSPPPPCPSTTTTTNYDTVTWYPNQSVCVGLGWDGTRYQKAQVTAVTTVVTTTRHCNGTTTQQTSTYADDLYCYYYNTGQWCAPSSYSFPPSCF